MFPRLRERLETHLRGLTRLAETVVEAGGAPYRITHPAAADALIDEEEFAEDESLPYWAELWPSAVALSDLLAGEGLSGRRVVELGCGVGLPGVVALAGGASVTATDHYAAALDFARYNALVNTGKDPGTRLLDWQAPVTGGLGSFDLVLAADVLYERRNVPPLVDLIPQLLASGGEVLVADPRRGEAPKFLEEMRASGFCHSTEERVVPSGERRDVVVLVHRLRRC